MICTHSLISIAHIWKQNNLGYINLSIRGKHHALDACFTLPLHSNNTILKGYVMEKYPGNAINYIFK